MFNIALPAGLKSWIVSSWKLLISATVMLSLEVLRTSPVYDVPILPTTKVFGFHSFMISPISVVVVVFPLVPVMAYTLPCSKLYASSISPHTVTPASLKARTIGLSIGTPGLITSRSVSLIILCGISPRIILTSQSFGSFALTSLSASFSLPSYKVIIAPVCARSLTAPIPLTPVPTTTIFLPSTFIITLFLSHFVLSQDMGVYFQKLL